MKNCLICQTNIDVFMDFGQQPIANGFVTNEQFNDEYFFHMQTAFCPKCTMVQLIEQPDREKMFHENYAFFSSTSNYMVKHFAAFVDDMTARQNLGENSFAVEIGCNDGILSQNFVKAGVPHLGVEPSKNVAEIARQKGINVTTEFFDKALAEATSEEYKKADAIFSANVMCHIPYMHSVFEGIKILLDENGIFAFEDPYLGDIIQKTSFDQIYDEHVFFFSAHSVSYLANMHGLELFDIAPQITHGGSMRYYITHKDAKPLSQNVSKQLEFEKSLGLHEGKTFTAFNAKIDKIKSDLIALLQKLHNEGKKVVAYGATSKSTTTANYFGITPQLIEFVSDTTPIKQGKYTPGMHIPVVSQETFAASKPDYVLLFAWNHAKEIMENEAAFMKSCGAKWIMYIPKVEIIEV